VSNAEKQPTGHSPEGCDENEPAAVPRLRDQFRIDSDMRPPRALLAAHFHRNESHVIYGTGHYDFLTIRKRKAASEFGPG